MKLIKLVINEYFFFILSFMFMSLQGNMAKLSPIKGTTKKKVWEPLH
jgi:hypothetical protein